MTQFAQQASGRGSGLYRRLGRNMAYLAAGTGGAAVFSMLAVAINARALNAREFGLLILLQTSALMVRGALSFLTQQPIMKIGAEALADGDTVRLGGAIGMCLLVDLGGALGAALLAICAVFGAGEVLSLTGQEAKYALVFAAALPFTGYLSANGIFRLTDRFDLLGVLQAGSAFGILVVSGVLYGASASFEAYVWGWAGYLAVAGQVQLWAALRLIAKRGVKVNLQWQRVDPEDARTIRNYSFSSWGTVLVETVRTNGDSLLVGAIVGVVGAGIYNVAKQVAGILRKGTDIYASAAFPEVALLAAQRDTIAARLLLRRMLIAGAAAGLIGVLAMTLAGKSILHYGFGAQFVTGYGALLVLVAAAGLQLVSHTLAVFVQVYVSPGRLFAIYLGGVAAYLLVTPLAAARFGITGGALGQMGFSGTVIACAAIALRGIFWKGGARHRGASQE